MCLKKVAGVHPYDTRDQFGRERFHPFTPANHLTYRISKDRPDWYVCARRGRVVEPRLTLAVRNRYAKYSIDLKEGAECCSEYSVSFHYVKMDLMPRLHALLYGCRGAGAS
jgi:glycoprotein-N-acetylgalactosamine 3-beta-galactosyltransferase